MMNHEFAGTVMPVVKKLWGTKSFLEYWNEENQNVTFRVFSRFVAEEVVAAFREWAVQNPDAKRPEWGKIHATMKAAHGDTSASGGKGVEFPSGPMLDKWSRDKSDGDLTHLWFIVADKYRNAIDNGRKWWTFLEACDLRCDARVGLCWAADHSFDLRFKNGSDEWHLILTEYDKQQRQMAVDQWKFKREPLKPKPKPIEPPKEKPDEPGDLQGEPL